MCVYSELRVLRSLTYFCFLKMKSRFVVVISLIWLYVFQEFGISAKGLRDNVKSAFRRGKSWITESGVYRFNVG